ncbi:hypothetical protein BDF21DRAFT_416253 [Thamnidium elegans]|nr:hypothetical protein BDF21DRAFT_416253 [Thamnidium elegans]
MITRNTNIKNTVLAFYVLLATSLDILRLNAFFYIYIYCIYLLQYFFFLILTCNLHKKLLFIKDTKGQEQMPLLL